MTTNDLEVEQRHVDWAYEQLDELIARASRGLDQANDVLAYRAMLKMFKARIEPLEAARVAPRGFVVGRLDCTLPDLTTYYVGHQHIDGDGDHPDIVDFRAKLGERFYQAGFDDPMGVGRRRTFKMRNSTIERLSDEVLMTGFQPLSPVTESPTSTIEAGSSPEPADPGPEPDQSPTTPAPCTADEPEAPSESSGSDLEPEPAAAAAVVHEEPGPYVRARDLLLDELEATRSGRMQDVVATIQADQDRLMRADPGVPLVIQGGPGTGKTVVGVHRAAWVLYEQRRLLEEESILVVGPNPTFLDYIGDVLPSLGETRARQITLDDLGRTALTASQRSRLKATTVDPPAVNRIKGRAVMAGVIANAIWQSPPGDAVTLTAGHRRWTLDAEETKSVLRQARREAPAYRQARQPLSDALADLVVEKTRRRIQLVEKREARSDELAAARAAAAADIRGQGVARAMLPSLDPLRLVQRLFTERQVLARAADGLLTPDEQRELLTTPNTGKHKWSSADLPLIDEAAAVLTGEQMSYSHVVIDEAQDLSPMQWRMVQRRTRRGSLTLLGDLAQGTSPWAPESWDQVLGFLGLAEVGEVAELQLGYRVPHPVSEFACRLLEHIAPDLAAPTSFRPGEAVVIHHFDGLGEAIDLLRLSIEPDESTAVIAPEAMITSLTSALDNAGLLSGVTVTTPVETKGLEFDAVVVVEPAGIAAATPLGLRELFIALTRPTRRLTVLAEQPVPLELDVPTTCPCGMALVRTWRYCPTCGTRRGVTKVPPTQFASPAPHLLSHA